ICATATSSSARAASPYTVSVGIATSPPARRRCAASSIASPLDAETMAMAPTSLGGQTEALRRLAGQTVDGIRVGSGERQVAHLATRSRQRLAVQVQVRAGQGQHAAPVGRRAVAPQ